MLRRIHIIHVGFKYYHFEFSLYRYNVGHKTVDLTPNTSLVHILRVFFCVLSNGNLVSFLFSASFERLPRASFRLKLHYTQFRIFLLGLDKSNHLLTTKASNVCESFILVPSALLPSLVRSSCGHRDQPISKTLLMDFKSRQKKEWTLAPRAILLQLYGTIVETV